MFSRKKEEEKKEEYALGSKVIEKFLGDDYFPVKWGENWDKDLNVEWITVLKEHEKDLHWWRSDLHNPHPALPIMELFTWWDAKLIKSCEYMYRRFWSPTGRAWPAKVVNGYVYTTIIPRTDPDELRISGKYFMKILPIYADIFLDQWEKRYVPEIKKNLEFIFNYPYEEASLGELMWLLEEMIDIYDRHWKLHWILNFAQFASFLDFRETVRQILGDEKYNTPEVQDLLARILVSTDDVNWDSLKVLYEIKEVVKGNSAVRTLFESPKTDEEVWEELQKLEEGKEIYERIVKFLKEYGRKSLYVYEYDLPTWEEYPPTVIAQLRTYLAMDYDFYADKEWIITDQKEAIEKLMEMIPEDKKELVKEKMERAIRMAPLTPNHHFYIDQQTNAAAKYVLRELGKKFVKEGLLEEPYDILYLKYDEIRTLFADPSEIDAKALVKQRKEEREKAKELIPAPYVGTITEWSIKEEPYKQGLWGWSLEKLQQEKETYELAKTGKAKILKGLAAGAPKVIEGVVKVVEGPHEFDKVEDGDILVCDITSPAWISVYPKIKGVITNSGGLSSHPAIVSREFGIPCVVSTRIATRMLKDGMKVRLDGVNGIVTVLEEE
nr:PEP-utilizing enzyme [Thermococcus sp. MV5]